MYISFICIIYRQIYIIRHISIFSNTEKPIIVSLSNPLAVVIGDDITAECVVDWPVDPSLSSQSVEVQWSLNSQQIVAGTSVIVLPGNRRRYIVELNEVELAHSGLLKCQAFREVNVFSERETTIVVLCTYV